MVIIVFIPGVALFGATFYGLFIYAKYLGASSFEAIVAIFLFVGSCGSIAERVDRKRKVQNKNK
ncbi:hypothetical protein MTCD1_03538 [Colwellia marinimaniae]|uniref:Uncharacterized protein n=2 Tax=Colwelliaceae TaxID=267889 RepID=A0ABQ0N007_9GAMM|nr:hypothetical protein MTCD1_03538 [Colwellia marinimaniae]